MQRSTKAPISDYPVEFLIPFRIHEIDREEFGALCDKRGWERPSFWFYPGERKRPLAAEIQCSTWLTTEAIDPNQHSKDEYFQKVRRMFGISRRKFDQIWEKTVPPAWKHR